MVCQQEMTILRLDIRSDEKGHERETKDSRSSEFEAGLRLARKRARLSIWPGRECTGTGTVVAACEADEHA